MYLMPKYWTGAKRELLNGHIIYQAKTWRNFKLYKSYYKISEFTYLLLKLLVVLEFLFTIVCIICVRASSPHSLAILFMFLLLSAIVGLIIQDLKNKFIVKRSKAL